MADQLPTPQSDAEIARVRAENRAQKSTSGAAATPVQQPAAPSTIDTQYATNQRENIGTYKNLGDNGYSPATGMSQTAINAQRANEYAYAQQQAQQAPTPEQFAQMNRGATTVGEAAKAGVTDQKVVGSFKDTGEIPLSFGEKVATPTVGTESTTGATATPATTSTTATSTETPTQTPQDFVSRFMSKLSMSTDQFLNNTLSGYSSIIDDMKKLTEAQISGATKFAQDMQSTLAKREEFYQAEYGAQKALMQQSADMMSSIATQEKENAMKQNDLAARAADADYSTRLQMAEENQARYLGYLTSKFDAMGMADSSAGMRSIGKYLAAGEVAVTQVVQDKDTARAMYLAKGQEIATTYFKQAFQIEQTKQSNLLQLNNQFFEQSMKIMEAQITTEDTKNKQIMQASKDYAETKANILSKTFADVSTARQQALQQAEFSQKVLQDTLNNLHWDKSFEQSRKEFDQTFSLQERQENRAQDAQLTNATGYLWINGQQTSTRTIEGLSYEKQVEQWNKNFMRNAYESDRNFMRGVYESDRAYSTADTQNMLGNLNSMFTQTNDPRYLEQAHAIIEGQVGETVNMNKSKYPPIIQDDGTVIFQAKLNNGKLANGRTQCGEYSNDALGKPGFFGDSLESKRSRINSATPAAGGSFIQDTGTDTGHVGQVEGVRYDDNGRPVQMQISDSNYKGKDKFDRTVIDISYKSDGTPVYKRNGKTVKIDGFYAAKTGGNGTFEFSGASKSSIGDKKLQNEFNLVSTSLSSEQLKNATTQLKAYIQNGDKKGAENYINQIAIQHLSGAEKDNYNSMSDVMSESSRVLREYDSNGVKGGAWAQIANSNKKWADMDQDPKYLQFYGDALRATAGFKHLLSGSNVTPSEMEQSQAFLPNNNDTPNDIMIKIKGMHDFAQRITGNILNRAKGVSSTDQQSEPAFSGTQNTSAFSKAAKSISNTVIMKDRNGQSYQIPLDMIEEAKNDGLN